MNNAVATPAQNTNIHFNETQWLQALFLLADTQSWLQQLKEGLIWQLPVKHRRVGHHRLPRGILPENGVSSPSPGGQEPTSIVNVVFLLTSGSLLFSLLLFCGKK